MSFRKVGRPALQHLVVGHRGLELQEVPLVLGIVAGPLGPQEQAFVTRPAEPGSFARRFTMICP